MNYKPAFNLTLLTAVLYSALAQADGQWAEKHFNPAPAADDVILPMPCGGSMVFRKVYTPNINPLADLPIQLGQQRDELGFLENARDDYIAGTFTEAEGNARYYLMSKYEVTELQYKALTDSECVSSSNKLRLPAVNKSWMQAMNAANQYNLWLRKEAKDQLPQEDQVFGFVRLPTEAEWEFAARGGIEVTSAEYQETRYPMPAGLNNYEWYAGAQSANGNLQLAGLLKPNPLGLHDMLGNASEMMFESFRLNKLNREHGQAGGYTIRGGNFLSTTDDIRSSLRVEESFYNEEGERTTKTTGFRFVLSAPSMTSRERVQEIERSWNNLGSGNEQDGSQQATQALTQLSASVEDEKLKKQLKELENQLRVSNQLQEESRSQAIRASLNLGAFLCTKLLDDGQHFDFISENYKTNCEIETPDSTCEMRKERLQDQQGRLQGVSNYYASSLIDSAKLYGQQAISNEYPVMLELIQRNPKLVELKPFLETHWKNQQDYFKSKNITQELWLNSCKSIKSL
ncbi:formylglycine-generating enzyme family protein [Thiopseudomonas alkaliphila]|uniref:formylglycine-generating enzyme family protein n=1 Tax=Thiopseudomonas alkaliphila TaxID=1697053 RepID=UPI00069F9E25|nr:SUMF1/EgtB/PvdO family nonheme iron enzyme [Thiopseudomonas alkaliphila]AKX51990.1 hypothetical protein AKN92_11270 [Thiopseudomonas alkaliphila]AKX58232.1 hypothetical protein AKN89_10830 [Thiopseudomonas alkaliphila]